MTSLRPMLRRAGAFSITLALIAVLAACSTPAETDDNTGGGTVAVVDGVVELSAADLAFDASVIQAPAGEPFTIRLTNNDSAEHNVSVYTQEGGDEIVIGEFIGQGESVDVEVPAQDSGEYYFVCDLHTNMNGAVVVEG